MWLIHWFEGGQDIETPPIPETYETYRYLGPRTFLTLPEIKGIGQEVIELQPLGFYTLPPDFEWTIRALEEGRLIS